MLAPSQTLAVTLPLAPVLCQPALSVSAPCVFCSNSFFCLICLLLSCILALSFDCFRIFQSSAPCPHDGCPLSSLALQPSASV